MTKEIFIGIIGSRVRDSPQDYQKVYDAYLEVWSQYAETHAIRIVSGGAFHGGDEFAVRIARSYGHKMITYFPDLSDVPNGLEGQGLAEKAYWDRNEMIARDSNILIACPRDGHCGTRHTMFRFRKLHPLGKMIVV